MKKIRILTFHRAQNYGAVLQAYALQKHLISAHHMEDVKNIDLNTNNQKRRYSFFIKNNNFKDVLINTFRLVLFIPILIKKNRFNSFLKNNLLLTKTFHSSQDLIESNIQMDYCIVGSDQVFNPNNPDWQAFYLDFENSGLNKIAYAASFGINKFSQEIESQIKKNITDFNKISCREASGSEFVEKITKSRIPTVLDPVFLLNKNQWNKLVGIKKAKKPYILIYDLNGGEELIRIAKKINSTNKYKIFCITHKAHRFYDVDKRITSAGPEQFLQLFSSANIILTDSFHGTAFSLIFEKPFFSYIALSKKSSRITELLGLLNLEHQIITSESDKFNLDINYDKVNQLLNDKIKFSEEFLNDALKN
jgi:hypothetical protein